MKLVTEWLKELPEPYQSLAIKYNKEQKRHNNNAQAATLKSAIVQAFAWVKTKEGFKKWYKLFNTLKYAK